MENSLMVLFSCGLGVFLSEYTQGSQCTNKHKTEDLNWEMFDGFITSAFDNCTTCNTSLEWSTLSYNKTLCVIKQNLCFNWNCSCTDKNNVNSSLKVGETTFKCSGHISTETEIYDNETRSVTDDAVSNNTTAKELCQEANINHCDVIQIQPFSLSVGIALGTFVGSVLTFCVMRLCNSKRQKRTKVPNQSTFSDEISLCKRGMSETQNETLLFNDELNPSSLYTEIAVNNECENVHIVNSETVTDNEYLEPNSPIEDEPIIRPVEGRKSSNEYSHVYNHLKPNIRHDVEPDVCNPDNVTSRIYNVTVSDEKDDQYSETIRTHNMDNGLDEGNVFEVGRSSSDTQLKVITLNGDEECFP